MDKKKLLLLVAALLVAVGTAFAARSLFMGASTPQAVAKVEPKGFFSKLFSRSPDAAAPVKYQIQVRSEGDKSTVTVLNTQGQPETSANAQRIVRVITDDMK